MSGALLSIFPPKLADNIWYIIIPYSVWLTCMAQTPTLSRKKTSRSMTTLEHRQSNYAKHVLLYSLRQCGGCVGVVCITSDCLISSKKESNLTTHNQHLLKLLQHHRKCYKEQPPAPPPLKYKSKPMELKEPNDPNEPEEPKETKQRRVVTRLC